MGVGVRAACAAPAWVQASSLRDATAMCEGNGACDFFTWSPVLELAAICHGNTGNFLKDTGGSLVSIKKGKLEEHIDGYRIFANYQAVCETGTLITTVPAVFSLDDASSACSREASCTFFTMSTPAGTEGLPDRSKNTLCLCSGKPSFVHHLGWLTAAKDEMPDVV